jgi:hypothetical protein
MHHCDRCGQDYDEGDTAYMGHATHKEHRCMEAQLRTERVLAERYRKVLERISAWDPRDGEDPRHWARDALRGYSVDDGPVTAARVRERFGM